MKLTVQQLRHIIAEELSKFLPEAEIDEELKSAATAIPDPEVFIAYTFKGDVTKADGEEFAGYPFEGDEKNPRYFYGDRQKKLDIPDNMRKEFETLSEKEKIKSVYGDGREINRRLVLALRLDLERLLKTWLTNADKRLGDNLKNLDELVEAWWESEEPFQKNLGFQTLARDIENVKIENLGVKFLEHAKEILFPRLSKDVSKNTLSRLDASERNQVRTAKRFGIPIEAIIYHRNTPPNIPIPDEARQIFTSKILGLYASIGTRKSQNIKLYKKYYSEVLSTTMGAGFLRKLKGAFAEVKNNIHALFVPNLAFQGWLTTKSGEGAGAGAKRVKILDKDDNFIKTIVKDYEFLIRGQDVKMAGGKFKSVADKDSINKLKKSTKNYISSIPKEDTLVIILTTRGGLSAVNTKFILSPWLVLHSMMDDVAANRAAASGDADRVRDFMTHTVKGGWSEKSERHIEKMHKLSIQFQNKAEEMFRNASDLSTRKEFFDALGKKIFNIYSFQRIGFSTMTPSDISAEVFVDVTMKPLGSGKGARRVERWRINPETGQKEKVQNKIGYEDNTLEVYRNKVPTEIKVGENDLYELAEIRRKLYIYAKAASKSYFEALEGKVVVLITS